MLLHKFDLLTAIVDKSLLLIGHLGGSVDQRFEEDRQLVFLSHFFVLGIVDHIDAFDLEIYGTSISIFIQVFLWIKIAVLFFDMKSYALHSEVVLSVTVNK